MAERAHRLRHRFPAALLPAALGLAAASPPALAVPPDVRARWEEGWHIVRPGDTLEGLASQYLGSHELWTELHALNPSLANPHRIYPGQRLRVLHDPPTPVPTAQVEAVSKRVEERPQPVPWRPAAVGDLLLENDSLRSFADGSARLRFDDGSTVTVGAESLIFLRAQSPAAASQPRKEIEVLVGQADLAARGAAGKRQDIEVIVGAARSRGSASEQQPLVTRSRRVEGDAAQFMTYEGSARVAARGREVEVAAGSGTSVAANAAPGPVERLLAAPRQVSPGEGEEVERAAIELRWEPVEGAVAYLVEVCLDTVCGAIHERSWTTDATRSTLREAPGEALFWRVTARSASGLDGFPSATRPLQPVESVAPAAPVVALWLDDAAVPAGACVAVPPQVRVDARDRAGSELPWQLLVGGTAAGPAGLAQLAGQPGRHTVVARATDARGRSADSPPLAFELDVVAPWLELGGGESGPTRAEIANAARRARRAAAGAPVACNGLRLEVASASNGHFEPLPCGAAPAPLRFDAAGTEAAYTLRVAGTTARLGERVEAAAGGRFDLVARDLGCGLESVALRLVPSTFEPGRLLLEAEVRDRAGHSRRIGWHLDRAAAVAGEGKTSRRTGRR